MKRIRDTRATAAAALGLDVIDVRLKQTDLPDQNLDATFARMRAEREREAADEIARGKEAAQRVRALADRTVVELVSDARAREPRSSRGEADARAQRDLRRRLRRATRSSSRSTARSTAYQRALQEQQLDAGAVAGQRVLRLPQVRQAARRAAPNRARVEAPPLRPRMSATAGGRRGRPMTPSACRRRPRRRRATRAEPRSRRRRGPPQATPGRRWPPTAARTPGSAPSTPRCPSRSRRPATTADAAADVQ